MEYDIFISYSRKDTAIVDQFVNRLTDAGYRVWIDRDGIYSGDQFKAKIVRAIKDSAIVLYFSSANSNTSEWTVKEISYSLKKGKTIIPVKLDGAEYEDSIDFDLVNIDFIQSDPNKPSACIDRLITSLAAHGCNRSATQTDETNSTPSQPQMSSEELFSLGKSHYDNEEYDQAVKYLLQAAEKGNANAQNYLGLCYYNGQGVQQDYQQAVKWYRKSLGQGNADAQKNLGLCYKNGHGVELDYLQAVHRFQKAATQGNADAQRHLGFCYYNGHGVCQDFQQAFFWYKKAAEQGHDYSQYFLGFCYEFGKGVKRDDQRAFYWYVKAAEQGNEYAIKRLKRLNAL